MAQSAANVNVAFNLDSASFESSAVRSRRVMAEALGGIQADLTKTQAGFARFAGATRGSLGNIGAQVQDIAVSLASGQRPLTVFIQQGAQLASAFGPAGIAIGALGAAVGGLATYFTSASDTASDAQEQLDKLTKSTDEYAEALKRAQPLEIARLQNIIDYASAAEKAAAIRFAPEAVIGRQPGGNAAQNPFVPGAGMLPGGLNPFTGQPIQQEIEQAKGAINRFESQTAEYLDAQYRARQRIEKAQQAIRDANKPGIIGKALTKPGLEERPYHQAEVAAAKESAAAAKVAATAAEVLAKQKAELIARLDEEVAASKRLTEAIGEGAYAQELANIENDKQVKILQASKTFKGEELEQQKKKIELLAQEARIRASIAEATPTAASVTQRQAERTSYDAYEKAAPDIAAKRIADEQKVADKLADIYSQPFKDLATNLANTLSGGIQDAISGDFDFGTFAEGFSAIFSDTLAASITAALTPALTSAAQSFGDYLMSALKGGTASLTPGAAALGGAAFGGIAGGLYGQYGPGMKPGNFAGVGGAIGGGLGGLAGSFIPGVGPIVGAGIGGLLGSIGGGFFGGQNNLGNDRSAQAYRSGRGITYGDTSFSPENRNITQGILDQVGELEKALATMGGAIADFGLRLEAGNKSGITVNGKKYPDAQAALAASLEVLIGGTTGLSASQQTVLSTTKAKDAQGIAADLDFAAQFDALTSTAGPLEAALKALDTQMQAFARRAGELGLSVDAVAAAHQREAQALVDAQTAQQNQIRAAIQAIAPVGDQLSLQLAQLNDGVQELAKQAIAAGLPLDELAAAHQRAAANLVAANEQLKTSLLSQIEALAPSGNALAVQLSQLNDRVQELARSAIAAGLPLDQLAAAHQRAAAALVAAAAQAKAAVNLQVAQLNPNTNPLDLQLQQLQAQVDSIKPSLDATGQTWDALAVAHQAAAKKIVADHHATLRAAAESARAQRQAQADAAAQAKRQAQEEARARQQQLAAQRTSVYQQIAGLYGDNTLKGQLARLGEQVKELGRAAAEAGVPLRLVTKAHIAAANELRRVAAQQQRQVYSQIAATQGDTSVNAQLFNLDIQMRDLAKSASELGVPMRLVQDAYKRGAQLIWEEYAARQRNLYSQIAAARGDTSINTQLFNLDLQMQELAKSASALGVPMKMVQDAYKDAAAAIWDEYSARQTNLYGQIAAARGDTGINQQLANLDVQMKELAKSASELNVPMHLVQEAYAAAAKNIWAEYTARKTALYGEINAARGFNDINTQLAELDTRMNALAKSASELGVPMHLVQQAYADAAKNIWAEYHARQESLKIQISEIGYMGRPVDLALSRLNQQIQALGKELNAAGLPWDQLTEAHRRAAQQILDDWRESLREMQRQQQDMLQAITDAQRGAAGAIDQFLDPFKEALSSQGIGQGVYAGASLTESAMKEFRQILAEARTGDTGALGSLVGAGQGAIQQARQTFGSTAAFAEVFREVERGLREQQGVLEAKRDELLTQIGTYQKETIDELVRLRIQAIADLRADFQKLSRDLIVAVEGNA